MYIIYDMMFFKKNVSPFTETTICRCNMPCRKKGHFHCPFCEKTIRRKDCVSPHLNECFKRCVVMVPPHPPSSPAHPPSSPAHPPSSPPYPLSSSSAFCSVCVQPFLLSDVLFVFIGKNCLLCYWNFVYKILHFYQCGTVLSFPNNIASVKISIIFLYSC